MKDITTNDKKETRKREEEKQVKGEEGIRDEGERGGRWQRGKEEETDEITIGSERS